jgi:hypothetical protein
MRSQLNPPSNKLISADAFVAAGMRQTTPRAVRRFPSTGVDSGDSAAASSEMFSTNTLLPMTQAEI